MRRVIFEITLGKALCFQFLSLEDFAHLKICFKKTKFSDAHNPQPGKVILLHSGLFLIVKCPLTVTQNTPMGVPAAART